MVRSEKELEKMIDEAMSKKGKFPGMTYEEGIIAALEWAMYQYGDESPLD